MRKKLDGTAVVEARSPRTEEDLLLLHIVQKDRCLARLGLNADTVAKMVDDFVASHGSVTLCPAAYALASPQYRLPETHR